MMVDNDWTAITSVHMSHRCRQTYKIPASVHRAVHLHVQGLHQGRIGEVVMDACEAFLAREPDQQLAVLQQVRTRHPVGTTASWVGFTVRIDDSVDAALREGVKQIVTMTAAPVTLGWFLAAALGDHLDRYPPQHTGFQHLKPLKPGRRQRSRRAPDLVVIVDDDDDVAA